MMLKFTAEQLGQLQTGLSSLQGSPELVVPPVHAPTAQVPGVGCQAVSGKSVGCQAVSGKSQPPLGRSERGTHPPVRSAPIVIKTERAANWAKNERGIPTGELSIPYWAITAGYSLVWVGIAVCLLTLPSHIHQCAVALCPVLLTTICLHACTTRNPLILSVSATLVAAAPYVCYVRPMVGVQVWCVGLCVLYGLHSEGSLRVLAGFALAACCCSAVVSLSTTGPPYIRHAGTATALVMAYVAACTSKRHKHIIIRIDSV